MSEQECTVLAYIRACGAISAADLGHRCGLRLEALYGALVALEARGLVRIVVNHIRGYPHERLWRAV